MCVSCSGKPEAAEGEHHQASQREAEAGEGAGLVVLKISVFAIRC